ncbi:MAG: CGGC domain-containing protein [Desulfobacterales bacterium]|nr:CGGC domain-containing protein [Desulfobacterales bacterium]
MARIGIIRCEKNETRCPLTGCINCLNTTVQGFERYDEAQLVGVFTCRCPGDHVVEMGKILKSKGAEAIHVCTCTFAHKEDGQWVSGRGFCDHVDDLLARIAQEADIACVKGSAHLPQGYRPESFG